ncbi:hypothetical protein GCM10009682_53560 [Luedemannella flava]|uniref:Uncharacterized protein n=1 Tax=Luedemannella flava TaxID=349316 RepID=A0ABN2MKR6_9ACTN
MTRKVLALVSVLLLSACTATPTDTGAQTPATGLSAPATSAAGTPSSRTVASFFSPPKEFPGPTWTKKGKSVDNNELNSIAGSDHCGWESAVMMHLGWPLGTVAKTSATMRQFIRDPGGVITDRFQPGLKLHVSMPPDGKDTGYRNGDLELWLAPSDPDGAYLRVDSDVERWPIANPVVACM